MAVKASICLLSILLISIHCQSDDYVRQNIVLNSQVANIIWNEVAILGNSTHFDFPVSMGTTAACDEELQGQVFSDTFTLHTNYTDWDLSYKTNINLLPSLLYLKGFAFRKATTADLTISSEIVTLKGCFQACITLKDFVCRTFDFYRTENHVCSLFRSNGQLGNIRADHFVGNNPASDHYVILPRGTVHPKCDGDLAHPYFALGWKALEAGWYDLSKDQFKKALEIDPDYYIAAIGLIFSNENMGYGLTDDVIGSYKNKLQEISARDDKELKLTEQYMLLLRGLVALHNAESLRTGLKEMSKVFSSDNEVRRNNIVKVIAGNVNLLDYNAFTPLARISRNNVFALHYLTHNLNPYGNGEKRTSPVLRAAAVDAVHTYQDLEIDGAWEINSDCIDIAEYYAKWSLAKQRIDAQRFFMLKDRSRLFQNEGGDVVVKELDVKYMSISHERITTYERLHFIRLQMGLFKLAKQQLNSLTAELKDDDKELKNILFRMAANAFFTTYDYVYDRYAQEIEFEEDWKLPLAQTTSDLGLASRAYYWSAAAVQSLTSSSPSSALVTEILDTLAQAKERTSDKYKTLISVYEFIVTGTRNEAGENYDAAARDADSAAAQYEEIATTDWSISGNSESLYYRPLIPIGYQFKADMTSRLQAASKLTGESPIDTVINSYKDGVDTPPLNQSRLLLGYGNSLMKKYGSTPKRRNEEYPLHVQALQELLKAWEKPDEPLESLSTANNSLESYFEREPVDCPADEFTLTSAGYLCWGGWIIIGVAIAVLVIVAIVIGIICLRRKAAKPQKDKEKAQGFIFSGPDLSQREDNDGSFIMGSMRSGSPEATPYASQTLDLKRNYSNSDIDYSVRSNTMGGTYTEAYSAH